MNRLLLIFILIFSFQSLTNAEDIRDFEVEGMSIGKSVLDYFDKKEINSKEKLFFPNSKKYYRIAFKLQNNSKYDFVAFYVLNNDKDLIIHGLEGMKYIDFSPCKEKQKKIAYSLKDVFSDFKENRYDGLHDLDNKSPFYSIDFDFTNGSTSRIICTDYKKKLEEKGYNDNLAVYLFESKFNTWANTEAY